MCRSVIIKGMEALLAESLLTARRHGVEDAVLASLQDLFPVGDWRALARYMISRSLQHGRRRAEEMREAVKTVAEAGTVLDRKSTRLNSSHLGSSYAGSCLKKKKTLE